MTVLVLTNEQDVTADRVVDLLGQRGAAVFRCDTAWFGAQLAAAARLDGGRWAGLLSTAHRRVRLEEVSAVWYRRPTSFQFPESLTGPELAHARREAKFGFGGVLAALPVLWVNHPGREADACYKPVGLATAAACGLAVPRTLVTNRAEAVREFAAAVGRVVVKPFGAIHVMEDGVAKVALTHLLTTAELAKLDGVDTTTHQFQEWIDKQYEVRLTAVGHRLFAAAIHAGSAEAVIDRRADVPALSYSIIEPPAPVAAGVRHYMTTLGLTYAAFDFVVRPDGSWEFARSERGRGIRLDRGPHRPSDQRRAGRPAPAGREGTDVNTPWQQHAAGLADKLADDGVLSDPAWRQAFAGTPRHEFVPRFYALDEHNAPRIPIDAGSDLQRLLAEVYTDQFLVTQVAQRTAADWQPMFLGTSSASMPTVVASMLEALDVHDGHRVLEIGTGTGYNAALLCHRLGDAQVTTIDIDPDLTKQASARLAAAGHHPTVACGNGAAGVADRAPFDRIIATCAVEAIPGPWIAQLALGGRLVAPLSFGGALAVLDKTDFDHAAGHLDTAAVYFMPLRETANQPVPDGFLPELPEPTSNASTHHGFTDVDPGVLNETDFALWLHLYLPAARTTTLYDDPDQAPTAIVVYEPAGHSTTVTLQPAADGLWPVTQDPRRLWDTVETAWRAYDRDGHPDRTRIGLTATTAGLTRAWLDQPDTGLTWPIAR